MNDATNTSVPDPVTPPNKYAVMGAEMTAATMPVKIPANPA